MTSPALATGARPAAPTPLRRVLIANRGEIALRVIRACRDLGIESVLAFSDADRDSLPVRLADRAVCVGPPQAAASYLNADAILVAASALGADAIHPGYGFLSENAGFSAACDAAGIRFVGPRPRAVEVMGNKMAARKMAADLGVPVVPGSTVGGDIDDVAAVAERIGYPVIIKAAAGGGGRGMRLVAGPEELRDVVTSASAEAQSAFGDGSVYVEKYVGNARHVEIQVAFDEQGAGIHLGERDCTIQRRYQKLIEEAPSPAIDEPTRGAMAASALRLCEAVDYRGVGTVEFLFDQDAGTFYFIEMNTRLQVEHPVTEMISGIDIVREQIRIASGLPLSFKQEDVKFNGHAIECRVTAENPDTFMPTPGRVRDYHPPGGLGVRVDSALYAGYRIPPNYDSLIAKLVVHGQSRNECLMRLKRALKEFVIDGVETTIPLHQRLIAAPDFINGHYDIHWLERFCGLKN